MSDDLRLTITTNEGTQRAELQLLDAAEVQLAYHTAEFGALEVSTRDALFDLRSYLLRFVEPKDHQAAVQQIGVVIAETVLGEEIFAKLWAPRNPRTLQIRLPAATAQGRWRWRSPGFRGRSPGRPRARKVWRNGTCWCVWCRPGWWRLRSRCLLKTSCGSCSFSPRRADRHPWACGRSVWSWSSFSARRSTRNAGWWRSSSVTG